MIRFHLSRHLNFHKYGNKSISIIFMILRFFFNFLVKLFVRIVKYILRNKVNIIDFPRNRLKLL